MTEPFPGFPTDLQAQMMALMTTADGRLDDHRDDLREPLHACAGADAHGRQHQRARRLGHGARRAEADRRARSWRPTCAPRSRWCWPALAAEGETMSTASITSTAATSGSRRSSRPAAPTSSGSGSGMMADRAQAALPARRRRGSGGRSRPCCRTRWCRCGTCAYLRRRAALRAGRQPLPLGAADRDRPRRPDWRTPFAPCVFDERDGGPPPRHRPRERASTACSSC